MRLCFSILLITTLFINILISCTTNDSSLSSIGFAYDNSLQQWNELKQTNGDSYKYEIQSGSVFGFGSSTKIIVENGNVKSRTYESYNLYDSDNNYLGFEDRIIIYSYAEASSDLNSNEYGAAPLTIDELYTICLSDYLTVNSNENDIYFSVDNDGILKDCNYYPHGCQDDCLLGITLSNFEWVK